HETLSITLGYPSTMGYPGRQMSQLSVENGGLHIVEECGIAMVVILPRSPILSVVAKQARHPRHGLVVRRQGAAVAEASENLERVEAETPGQPERSGALAIVGRPKRLGGVLNHR